MPQRNHIDWLSSV